MTGYSQYNWVCKAPNGYAVIKPDQVAYFDATLEQATRFESPRRAKNAVLAAATLEVLNGRTVPPIVYERIKETVEVDYVEIGPWDAHKRTARLMAIRDISRAVAEAYQWVMTSRDLDYAEWSCALLLPEWEFIDPDGETVEQRLAGINLPAIVSKRVVFLRREDDLSAARLLFDSILLCIALDDATILLDNRS